MRVGIDTNLLIRLIVDDDSAQVTAAHRLAREHHLVVTTTALLETEWILRRVLRLDRGQILAGFEGLLGLNSVTYLNRDLIDAAMRAFRTGCDFADALHAASAKGVDVFATFDRTFARRAKALDYLPPVRVLPATGILSA